MKVIEGVENTSSKDQDRGHCLTELEKVLVDLDARNKFINWRIEVSIGGRSLTSTRRTSWQLEDSGDERGSSQPSKQQRQNKPSNRRDQDTAEGTCCLVKKPESAHKIISVVAQQV